MINSVYSKTSSTLVKDFKKSSTSQDVTVNRIPVRMFNEHYNSSAGC